MTVQLIVAESKRVWNEHDLGRVSNGHRWAPIPAWKNYLRSCPIHPCVVSDLKKTYNARHENEQADENLIITILYFEASEDMMTWLLEWS